MHRGLLNKRNRGETIFDAIKQGVPVQELNQQAVQQQELEARNYQQEAIKNEINAADALKAAENAKPAVIAAGVGNSCPPGYTFALGYCVRNVHYYGCIPGVEFWDGTKCSRDWPNCGKDLNGNDIENDLNDGHCLVPEYRGLLTQEGAVNNVQNAVNTVQQAAQAVGAAQGGGFLFKPVEQVQVPTLTPAQVQQFTSPAFNMDILKPQVETVEPTGPVDFSGVDNLDLKINNLTPQTTTAIKTDLNLITQGLNQASGQRKVDQTVVDAFNRSIKRVSDEIYAAENEPGLTTWGGRQLQNAINDKKAELKKLQDDLADYTKFTTTPNFINRGLSVATSLNRMQQLEAAVPLYRQQIQKAIDAGNIAERMRLENEFGPIWDEYQALLNPPPGSLQQPESIIQQVQPQNPRIAELQQEIQDLQINANSVQELYNTAPDYLKSYYKNFLDNAISDLSSAQNELQGLL